MRLRVVSTPEISLRWDVFARCFKDVEKFTRGEYSADYLRARFRDNSMALAVLEDGETLLGAFAFSIKLPTAVIEYMGPARDLRPEDYSAIRYYFEQYAGGDGNILPLFEEFSVMMRGVGVTSVYARMRPSFARLLERLGAEVLYSVCRFKIQR